MPSESEEISKLDEKMDGISKEILEIKKTLDQISTISDIDTKVQGIEKTLDNLQKTLDGLNKEVKTTAKDNTSAEVNERTKEMLKKIDGLDSIIKELHDKRIDVLDKKIDDMQQYVAGLSVLEEKLEEITQSSSETKEIVSIIVRQLDDIERKYNKAIEDLSKAVQKLESNQAQTADDKKTKTKKDESKKEAEPEVIPPDELPSDIDGLMDTLKEMVNPKTEAKAMAKALEQVRDKLTTIIEGHTPVLFQFGKRARELKSYPPTATLNENDIARLNKDIREWVNKLEKV